MSKKIKFVCLSSLIVLFLLCTVLALSLDIKKVYAEAQPLESGTHTCNGMEFEKFNDYSSQNYNLYLSEDFNNENAIGYSGLNINICLNGKSLHYTGGMNFSQCTVNFYDCSTLETGKVKNQIRVMADTTLTINGGTFKEVSAGEMAIYPGGAKADIVINEGVVEELNDKPYPNADCIFNGSITINGGVVKNIKVQNGRSVLSINGGTVGENNTLIIACKELHITGGMIGLFLVALSDYTAATPIERGKMYISGSPNFIYPEVGMGLVGFAGNDINGNFSVVGFPYIVLNNGENGAEYREYTGNPIGIALMIASGGAKANLVGQTMAEGVTDSNADKLYLFDDINMQVDATYMLKREGDILKFDKIPIELFGENTKFYRNNLWDTFRSPAYPSSDRPFFLYDLSAPFDAKMNRIDFSGDKYVKFELNKTYTTVADLPTADKNRIVNSLKYSTYSNEQAILKALIVSEILYNGDGTVNRILANVGVIWSLGEQGFLYTSLDSNGAFPYSGGIGTYVTFKAHNDGESIVDTTPKDDPLSKDDFDPDGDGNGSVEIPALPETTPPVNNDVYLNYLGKVIDNNGNPLVGVNVAFSYSGTTFNVVTEGSGYFTVPDFLVTAGQEAATVYLLYHDGTTEYGIKTYLNMPIATDGAVTYIYPLTSATDDGTVQQPPHTLTAIDCVPPTCRAEGSIAYYVCQDSACGCGKIYGDAQGINEITSTEINIAKIPHTQEELSAVAATCTQTGLSSGSKCSICGEILSAQAVLPRLEHTFNDGEVTTPPTIDNEGEKTYTCSMCGETKLEALPKLTPIDKEKINLLWLVILLSIINFLELTAIILLLFNGRKTKMKTSNIKLNAALPLLFCGGQVIASHLALSVSLGIAAILQAAFIIFLAARIKRNDIKQPIEAKINISRQDIIDYIEDMADNKSHYPVAVNLTERRTENACDWLKCGEWYFALMHESKAEVIKFILRLKDDYAKEIMTAHSSVKSSGEGENWYKIIVDDTFSSKAEVYALLEEAYKYVLDNKYTFNDKIKAFETESEAAEADCAVVEKIAAEAEKADGDVIKLENERDAFNTMLLASLSFKPSKIEVAESVIAEFPTGEIEVSQRQNETSTNLPLADTFYSTSGISDKGIEKKVCFGYCYQLRDGAIKIILKLPKNYAESKAETHKTLCRSQFPKGKGWYVFRIDNSFKAMDELMPLFLTAKGFVEDTKDREIFNGGGN